MAKKETKCIICRKKASDPNRIQLKEWISDGKSEAIAGETLPVHTKCLSDTLYIERPEGFVYGRITLGKDEKDKKNE